MVYLLSVLTINVVLSYHWESLLSPGIRAYEHAVVYDPARDLFFVIGGDSTGNSDFMDICLEFDPKTNTWDTKESMPTRRSEHNASYRKGFIHVLCGEDETHIWTSTHEVYDINSDSWDTAAPAPAAPVGVSYQGVVTWRDSLVYLIIGEPILGSGVYYYDATTDSWDTATSFPLPFCGGGGIKIKGDSIFVVGGLTRRYIYIGEINPADPSEINWRRGVDAPFDRNSYNGLAIKNNKAYTIGGHYNDGTNEVWEYDIPTETWTSFPEYPIFSP